MNQEVIEYTREDIVWPFDGTPYVRVGRSKYGHKVDVDPTPAYGHSRELADRVLAEVAAAFPIDWPVSVSLLPVECLSRTNGATSCEADYDYDGPRDDQGNYRAHPLGTIYFSAKRIPPHPAMTRYLVAHEYGHVVEEWLNKGDGGKLWDNGLIKRYAEIRGLEAAKAYGAGVWHVTPGEVFANDFRILVCGVEAEFWPHAGIERPENLLAIRRFWEEQRDAARPPVQPSEVAAA